MKLIFPPKLITVLYRFIFPIITVLFLLVIASLTYRSNIFMSRCVDFFIRALLAAWYCQGYIRLSNLSSYRIYPNITWTKNDVQGVEKYVYQSLIIVSGIFLVIISWWTIQFYFSFMANFALPIAILNGVIVTIPALSQYWVFKL